MLEPAALLVILTGLGLTHANLFSLEDTHATFYYDLTLELCNGNGAPTPPDWQSTINPGIPFCEPDVGGRSLEQLGTNQIVAMSTAMVSGDPAKWCGKEVQILDASGTELTIPDGPFYIWDACDACVSDPHIDLPANAFVALQGGVCGDNPTGITVNVLDTNVKEWVQIGGGNPEPSNVVVPSVDLPTPSTQVVTVDTDLCPAKGQWQCAGTALQMCNYVGAPAHLEWQVINPTCASYCDITRTPMCA